MISARRLKGIHFCFQHVRVICCVLRSWCVCVFGSAMSYTLSSTLVHPKPVNFGTYAFPTPPPFCRVYPMAGAPRQSDYVTARYVTLPGQQQTLKFPRGASLGDMQKDLCSAFGKYYPFIEAQSQFVSPGASEIVVFVLHVPSEFV